MRLSKALVDSMKLSDGDEINVVEADSKTLVVAKAANKAAVLKELSKFRFERLADYKFDREEANKR